MLMPSFLAGFGSLAESADLDPSLNRSEWRGKAFPLSKYTLQMLLIHLSGDCIECWDRYGQRNDGTAAFIALLFRFSVLKARG